MKLFLILSVFLTNQIIEKLNDLQVIACKLDELTEFVIQGEEGIQIREADCKLKTKN